MPEIIKIPIQDLTNDFLRKLREQYRGADVEIRIQPPQGGSPLSEDDFWKIISLLDWEQEDEEAIVAPAVEYLAQLPVGHIYRFEDILSEKLYRLDTLAHADHSGENAYGDGEDFSVDEFLYARCCVVANGRKAYEGVLNDPQEMPKDLTFEPLLSLAAQAYERQTGRPFRYAPEYRYETFSHTEGFPSPR